MRLEITDEIRKKLVKARHEAQLTQLELNTKSKVGERTIKDLESGRRTSFTETTMISLCRALKLDYDELFSEPKAEEAKESIWKGKFPVRMIIGVALLAATALLVIILNILHNTPPQDKSEWKRLDHISDHKLPIIAFPPDTLEWEGVIVNHYLVKQTPVTGDTIPVEIKWSYRYTKDDCRPQYFINAYAEWEPDEEIRIFEGVFHLEGSETREFMLGCPDDPGLYIVRVFFTSSFGPVPSFYGHAGDNQVAYPATARYIEIPIEIIAK